MSAQHTPGRVCDVLAALDARKLARTFRRQGLDAHAATAWRLVRDHLRRAAIAKATGSA